MSKTPDCILSSDWHLDSGAFVKLPALTGDGPFALEQITNICLNYGVPHFAAGDLFDTANPDPGSLRVAFEQCDRMARANLPVYFIMGDHESRPEGPHLGILGSRGPTYCDFELSGRQSGIPGRGAAGGGRIVVGMDFRRGDAMPRAIEAIEKKYGRDITLLCHQRWQEFMGDVARTDGRLADLPFQSVWTGDLHQCRRLGSYQIYSPGATHMRAIDEPVEHHVWVMYDDGSAEKHKLKSRQAWRYAVDTETDLERILADVRRWCQPQSGVPKEIETNLVEVKFSPAVPRCAARLREAVAGRCHLKLEPITDSGEEADPYALTSHDDLTVLVRGAVPADDADDIIQLLELSASEQKQYLLHRRGEALETRST